jgi:D-alanine---D-serine ligase
MEKLKIAVLFGGCSPEYGISLQSAYSVITNIDSAKYELIVLGINRSGEWFYYSGIPEKIKDDTWENPNDCLKAIISPDRKTQGVLIFDNNIRSIKLDAAMPVLHGKNGEDGTIQGLLELAGIHIIGCNTLASALGMDKGKAHKIAEAAGICVPRSFTLRYRTDMADCIEQAEKLGYPLFVKPIKAGSSYGITKVLSETEISDAIKLAFEYDNEVIVEENIIGFEVGCAILGNDNYEVGAIYEVDLGVDAPENSFFDYNEKYFRSTARVHIPARIPSKKAEEVINTAIAIFKAVGCTGFARVDMFLMPDGKIVFNEINTIPGLTEYSHFTNVMKAVGISYKQIINKIIELGVEM